ncbi:hypothetical protein [Nannocystis punicea]|uniref:DUF3592 domain-containing protein n=1 Tax=Nannocystis punicea TaxID=2995304 RepID=A0ABY7GUN3_9BACT|nr:hypothetical protein [Nannocystis poenicansa]WAS90675.1 hypothetical protein O0S08_31190 [Nannocystis poenicansa]
MSVVVQDRLTSVRPLPAQLHDGEPPPWPSPSLAEPEFHYQGPEFLILWIAGTVAISSAPVVLAADAPWARGLGGAVALTGALAFVVYWFRYRARRREQLDRHERARKDVRPCWARVRSVDIVDTYATETSQRFVVRLGLAVWLPGRGSGGATTDLVEASLSLGPELVDQVTPGVYLGVQYDAQTRQSWPRTLVTPHGTQLSLLRE